MMGRRHLSLLLGLALLGSTVPPEPTGADGPNFWVVKRGEARVFILGFGEARDTSWLTPSIRQAFEASSELRLETDRPYSCPAVLPGAAGA